MMESQKQKKKIIFYNFGDRSFLHMIHFVQPVHKGLGTKSSKDVIPVVTHYHRIAVQVVNLQLVLMKINTVISY